MAGCAIQDKTIFPGPPRLKLPAICANHPGDARIDGALNAVIQELQHNNPGMVLHLSGGPVLRFDGVFARPGIV